MDEQRWKADFGILGPEEEGSGSDYCAVLVSWGWVERCLGSSSNAEGNAFLTSFTPDLEAEASLPEKKGNTLSRDLIEYVHYMVENHGEDYKVRPPGKNHLGLLGKYTGLF